MQKFLDNLILSCKDETLNDKTAINTGSVSKNFFIYFFITFVTSYDYTIYKCYSKIKFELIFLNE